MMKLKYLFDNRDLTHMILNNWDHDTDKPGILDNYRISANAVYPFLRLPKKSQLRVVENKVVSRVI